MWGLGTGDRGRVYKTIKIEISFEDSKESLFWTLWELFYCSSTIYSSPVSYCWMFCLKFSLPLFSLSPWFSTSKMESSETGWFFVLHLHSQTCWLLELPVTVCLLFFLSITPASDVLWLVLRLNMARMENELNYCLHQTYTCINTEIIPV